METPTDQTRRSLKNKGKYQKKKLKRQKQQMKKRLSPSYDIWISRTTFHDSFGSDECKHFFVFLEEKEIESCAGTHYTECAYCPTSYFRYYSDTYGKNRSHFSKNDEELHVHCWDKMDDNKYECCANKSGGKKGNIEYRVKCGQILQI
jgi:hypothetical protein